jgi:Ca2+-transporting ATPase
VEKINPQQIFDENQRVYEEPFDSEKKYMLTMNRMDGDEKSFLIGAAEIVLSFCDLPQKERDVFSAEIEEWAGEGLKIMGLAFKEKGDLKEKKKFIWLGLLAIEDPLRKEAKEAIAIVRQAGIKVKIVTGDYQKTAEKVALNLGLEVGPENIMDGAELESISESELKNKIGDIVVFARVTPHQKQKIVRVLQQQGEIVAMTGDGVNDTPALKKADIGVAVGDASDMAKEVADLILLDNNFKTIVSAVEEGRLIFSNIKKVVAYVLSNSFVEIFLIFGAMLLNLPFPLTVVQILWLHLICDGPPDIVLGFEPKERGLMKDRPADLKKESVLSNQMKVLIFGISFIIGILCLLFFKYVLDRHEDLALARSTIFTTVAMVDLIYIFSFKNLKRPLFKTENFFKNKFLFLGVAYGLILTFAAVYLPALNRILGTQPLDLSHWGPVLGVALVTLLWTELVKYFYNRHGSSLDRQNKIK